LLVKSPAEGAVFTIYLGALLFGGVLIAASALGIGHDAHIGDGGGGDVHAGVGDGHDQGHGSNWLALFGIRFWSFGTAFFGLTGLVLRGLGFSALAPFLGTAVGVAAGLGASATFRALSREVVGQVPAAEALVGREGRLLLPVASAQRGKVRIAAPGGGDVDFVAESDEALDAGSAVLIVEVKGNVVVVARAPASATAPRA
jgi:membrane protein implicated in regulation of membrane protease activity